MSRTSNRQKAVIDNRLSKLNKLLGFCLDKAEAETKGISHLYVKQYNPNGPQPLYSLMETKTIASITCNVMDTPGTSFFEQNSAYRLTFDQMSSYINELIKSLTAVELQVMKSQSNKNL